MYAKECETNQHPPCIVLSNELLFATEWSIKWMNVLSNVLSNELLFATEWSIKWINVFLAVFSAPFDEFCSFLPVYLFEANSPRSEKSRKKEKVVKN